MSGKQYPCLSCGAKLEFSPGASTLKCPYCGHANEIPKSIDDIKELDFNEYFRKARDQAETKEQSAIKCSSCGAQTTLPPNVAVTYCPFCGTQLNAQPHGQKIIKPQAILPFKVDKNAALDKFREWMGNLWFAPGNLKSYAHAEGIKGMYIPYWTYNCNTVSFYDGERGVDYQETETYMENDEVKTRSVTRTRWYPVSGLVSDGFTDVLVLASQSLPRGITEALEPWDLAHLTPYQDEYMSGFGAESYQLDLPAGFEQAKGIMDRKIQDDVRRDIGGDHQKIIRLRTRYDNITFKHILLPLWISAYRYEDKVFRFLINARTGEVQGERPWSWSKIAMAVGGALTAVLIIYYIIQVFK